MYQKQQESKIYSHLLFGMFENMLSWIFNPNPLVIRDEDCSQKVIIHIREEGWRPHFFYESQKPDIENQLGPIYDGP
ncbi:MAG: hypothetical protein EBQ95_02365 [Gammaproteobacteria bacterium]|nr:hypothetical protein [Gammaproteobacteria bacterium]